MQIDFQKLVLGVGGVMTITAAITTLGNYVVWTPNYERDKSDLMAKHDRDLKAVKHKLDREVNRIFLQITEREIQMREEAICWWQSQGQEAQVQMCMQEFAREKAIRLYEALNTAQKLGID